MYFQGVHYPNSTCRRCRKRHPATWGCAEAAWVAKQERVTPPAPTPEEDRQAWLDAFIERAGFSWGWEALESWARRMAEQAYEERVK